MRQPLESFVEAMVILATEPDMSDSRVRRCVEMVFLTLRFARLRLGVGVIPPPSGSMEIQGARRTIRELDTALERMPLPHCINRMFWALTVALAQEVTFMAEHNTDWRWHAVRVVTAVRWFLSAAGLWSLVPPEPEPGCGWDAADDDEDQDQESACDSESGTEAERAQRLTEAMSVFEQHLRAAGLVEVCWPETAEVRRVLFPLLAATW